MATEANTSTKSVTQQLQEISDEIADTPRPDKDDPVETHREYKKTMNELSKKAAALRRKQIDEDSSLDDKEKEVLKLYDKGVQIFAIAQKVYEFANRDTVGRVSLIIRKAHADDWSEVEDVESTKGYTGIGVSN